MTSVETGDVNSIFVDGSQASEQSLQDLRTLLIRLGMHVKKKDARHSTLQVYPYGYGSYPLLNPRFDKSAAYIDPKWAKQCIVFNVISRGSGDAIDVSLSRFTSTEARGMEGVSNVAEFIDAKLIPKGKVRIAAFDGENADPANGRHMGDDVYARTPWGEIAYALAGKAGYERVRKSDELVSAPGAETLRELFGGEPTLILLDELSVYIRKVHNLPNARDQLTAFLTSLFKAIEGTSNAALVYTLAIGKDGKATDAYCDENQFIADRMAEAESVSARKATLLNPTEDDETVQVLRRRLFTSIDDAKAAVVIDGYRAQWAANKDALPAYAGYPETVDAFRKCYPLHPEILETLTSKTATLQNFQRVRGMLRLLARSVSSVWQKKPGDAAAIHLHHIDLGYEPIRQEIITRLQQGAFSPAMSNDVAGAGGNRSLAEDLDYQHYKGVAPYTAYVARTVFLHSLAYNDPLIWASSKTLANDSYLSLHTLSKPFPGASP